MDVVLDNAGLELYTDLLLADFLVASGLAGTVTLHGKLLPWFVSDTTAGDLEAVLRALEAAAPPEGMAVCGGAGRGGERVRDRGAARWGKGEWAQSAAAGPLLAASLPSRACAHSGRPAPPCPSVTRATGTCPPSPSATPPRPARCRRSSGARCGGSRPGGAATSRRGAGPTATTPSGPPPSPFGGWSRWGPVTQGHQPGDQPPGGLPGGRRG